MLGKVGITLFFKLIHRQLRQLFLPSVEMWFCGERDNDRDGRKEYGRERKRHTGRGEANQGSEPDSVRRSSTSSTLITSSSYDEPPSLMCNLRYKTLDSLDCWFFGRKGEGEGRLEERGRENLPSPFLVMRGGTCLPLSPEEWRKGGTSPYHPAYGGNDAKIRQLYDSNQQIVHSNNPLITIVDQLLYVTMLHIMSSYFTVHNIVFNVLNLYKQDNKT